jgi:acetyltransferase-like isoleucine patch superfamily enzyme
MEIIRSLRAALAALQAEKRQRFNRRLSVGDLLTDRWEIAQEYGWGEGASCYDNVLVLGDVKVGRQTWIGPNVILDGSGGGLEIGEFCSISAGVHIYTHHTLEWSRSLGAKSPAIAPSRIGSGVYIGPNSVIQMGVTVGDRAVIGALSFVNFDVPPNALVTGRPARVVRYYPD